MNPAKIVKLAALLTLALQLGGCGSAGARFYPLGGADTQYTAPVPADKVELFITKKPDYKYTELGIITFDTAASFADEPRAYQKLREKAGEIGLGFAVVARQIRRLADKTSNAASDIENAVRQMQSAVNSGVMEMDRFGASMRQSLKIILETADSLSRVVGDIEGIGPKFENIAGRIAGMSDSAKRISRTMLELSENSARARDTVTEFKSATFTLDSTSASLLDEVSRFKTAEGSGNK